MWFISSILLFLHAYLVLSSNNNEAEDFANQRVANQYIIMCRAYLSRGAIDKAIKELQKAIHRAPRYIEPYFMRGSLFMESNELQPAVEDFLQVLHLSEGQNTTSLAHAVAICKQMYKSRQFDVVVAPLSVLHTYNTSDEEVGRLYANTLLQLEQQVAALYVLEKYPLDLSTKEAMLKMASIYENANRYNESEAILLSALEKNFISDADLGYYYIRIDENVKSIDRFTTALNTSPCVEYELVLGLIYARLNDIPRAMVYYESALEAGHVTKEMRQFFAQHDNVTVLVDSSGSSNEDDDQLRRYILRKVAKRGGGYRHRWLIRQWAFQPRLVASERPAGESMRQVKSLGSVTAGTGSSGGHATPFELLNDAYDAPDEED